jgi:hypothetical protein
MDTKVDATQKHENRWIQCSRADGTLNWASVCDPGEHPISGWLHRDCEAAFLEGLNTEIQQRRSA